MKILAWFLGAIIVTLAVWSPLERANEWERVARFEHAVPHVYKVNALWVQGSAWVWDHDTFVTNYHVVEDMEKFIAHVRFSQGRQTWVATKITRLKDVDAALVDVKGVPLRVAPRHGRAMKRGQYVLVAGYPRNVGPIMTEGYVLDVNQTDIMADVAIRPGSSGGPCFDLDGNITGMTVAVSLPPGRSVAYLIPLMRIINGMERPEFSPADPCLGPE